MLHNKSFKKGILMWVFQTNFKQNIHSLGDENTLLFVYK